MRDGTENFCKNNFNKHIKRALAMASDGRMSLLNSSIDSISSLAFDYWNSRRRRAFYYQPVPSPYLAKFLDQNLREQALGPLGGRAY
jgi:hypothetical protein